MSGCRQNQVLRDIRLLDHFFGRLSVKPPDRFDPRSKTGIVAEGVDKSFTHPWPE